MLKNPVAILYSASKVKVMVMQNRMIINAKYYGRNVGEPDKHN